YEMRARSYIGRIIVWWRRRLSGTPRDFTCEWSHYIGMYLAAEMNWDQRQKMERHMVHCEWCAARLNMAMIIEISSNSSVVLSHGASAFRRLKSHPPLDAVEGSVGSESRQSLPYLVN